MKNKLRQQKRPLNERNAVRSGNRFLTCRKGQAVLITHAILVSFTIFMIFVVVNTFITLREDFQEFAAKSEVEQVCFIIKVGVEKLVPTTEYKPNTNAVSKLDINLPERLADTPYRANFANRTIMIETLSPRFNSTCKIGFDISYNGSTTGGLTELIFRRNLTADLVEMKNI